MRKQLPLLVLLLLPLLTLAQNVTVPKNVYFADVHLRISDEAQQEIQKKVDALHRNQVYFQKKVDLADAYFPIIERVFKEEGVPDDFKYLALQESGLIGDAVSTSNAVGYWQFKKEAAMDFNLRMDNVVDERRHIIEASRGAAKYFKRSNSNYDNWFTSLLSYYLGYTGVKTYSSPSDKGSKKMDINDKSHPYVITFLAHKIAYDNFVGKNKPVVSLQEMRAKPGQSLTEIAISTKTDYAELEKYNKWLLGNSIPSDKDYYILVPVRNTDRGLLASKDEKASPIAASSQMAAAVMVKRNGLNALVARPNDSKDKLALQAGISTRKFLRYNDLHNFDPIVAGSAYYIEKKNITAEKEYHIVQPGETMQMISQHYGIRLNYLLFKNRMSRTEVPVPGRVLWLQKRRPGSTPVEIRDLSQKQNTVALAPAKNKATETIEKPADAVETGPKENIVTRFINSFKRFKKEPIENLSSDAVVQEPASPATHQPSAAVATNEETVKVSKTEAATTEAVVTEQNAKPALYPAATKEKAAATESSEVVKPEAAKEKLAEKPKAVAEEETEVELIAEPAKEEAVIKKETEPSKKIVVAKGSSDISKAESSKATSEVKEVISNTKAITAAEPQANATRHIVKQGETLYAISRMYAVTVNDLTKWNGLGDEPLKLGQELLIAEPLTTPTAGSETEVITRTNKEYHTVVSGETLYQISKTYNVSLEKLRTWNNLSDNNIRLGQELRVQAPAGTTTSVNVEEEKVSSSSTTGTSTTGAMYHTVAAGESMYQISRRYGVTIKDIMEWNNKSDFSVSIGEKLLVKKK
ncbi:LysM peptidoglycan-binding domain-containing protein [Pontibacter locisalis]|uniref:LysM peptidoglycan-binding domain-containing protein n=1 Tax=Pontibacter locisalis TaxID=1719035 RepID=A0ABW5IMX5_9BACT